MKIAVIGAACTKFGELWDKSLQDLLAESQIKALHDAQIKTSQIDAIFTGNMCSALFVGQLHLGALSAQILNTNCPSTTIEGACASGGLAIRSGIAAIESGNAEVVLVNGVEKMTDLAASQITTGLIAAGSEEEEHFIGATFPALNALIAREYMHQLGLTKKQLAAVSVKNHKHGSLNPLAHFQKEINVEQVLNSQVIADPITVFDCAPISDGAASLILSTPEFAQKYMKKNIVYIIASEQASDTLTLAKRNSLSEFKATQIAAKKAYVQANIKPETIDVAELHDAFSITEIITLEDLGFAKQGLAGGMVEKGEFTFGKNLVINPSGGLKSKGHPVGASGVSQAYEVIMQLRNTTLSKQVHDAEIGLTHNIGGCGSTAVVHIFSKE